MDFRDFTKDLMKLSNKTMKNENGRLEGPDDRFYSIGGHDLMPSRPLVLSFRNQVRVEISKVNEFSKRRLYQEVINGL